LPKDTLEIIQLLEKQVGAPEYNKTPQFKSNYNNFNRKKKVNDNTYD